MIDQAERLSNMLNVPFEPFRCYRGTFVTWDVINVPRFTARRSSGTLVMSIA